MTRVGIVGAGGMGTRHADQYRKMPDVQISYFELDPKKSETFSNRFSVSAQSSFEDLIERSDVIDVCLPTNLHYKFCEQALSSGRHVFVEKPMAATVQEAEALAELALKRGVKLMPGHVVRYFPEFAAAYRTVKSGAIGNPAAARTRRGGKGPSRDITWFFDFDKSGGVLLDLMIHDFDWLRWTLGEVKSVYARSVLAGAPAPFETGTPLLGDYALATLTFASGAIAHVEGSWMDPSGFRTTFEVCGSEGMVEFDSRNSAALRTHTDGGSILESPLHSEDDPYYLELRGFLGAISNGQDPPVTSRDGVMAVRISMAAIESAKTGKAVNPGG